MKLTIKEIKFKKSKEIEAKCSEGDCGGDGKHILEKIKKNS